MDDVKMVLRMNRNKYDALKINLYKAGRNLEGELASMLARIYEESVPEEERKKVAERERSDYIEKEWQTTRVGALRICANGKEHFLLLDNHNRLLSLAQSFCTVKQKIGHMPFESICKYFSFAKPSDSATFEIYGSAIETNSRIFGLYDFDADKELLRIREYGDNGWRHYELTGVLDRMDYVSLMQDDISVRKLDDFFRDELNKNALISPPDEAEEVGQEIKL